LGGEEGWGIFVNKCCYSGWCFYYCHHMANQKEWNKTNITMNKLWIKFCVVSASCLLLEWNIMYTFQLVWEQICNGKRCSNNSIISTPIIWLMEAVARYQIISKVYDVVCQFKFKELRSSYDIIVDLFKIYNTVCNNLVQALF
jgi:hypothetical protein